GAPPNGSSYTPWVSADGRRVIFCSEASNLVPNDTNGGVDLFVYDRGKKTLRLLPPPYLHQGGSSSFMPSMAADGRLAAMASYGTPPNLHEVVTRAPLLCDLETGRMWPVRHGGGACYGRPYLSPDGKLLAVSTFGDQYLPFDTNNTTD